MLEVTVKLPTLEMPPPMLSEKLPLIVLPVTVQILSAEDRAAEVRCKAAGERQSVDGHCFVCESPIVDVENARVVLRVDRQEVSRPNQ